MSAVVRDSPVIGRSSAKAASDGIVYSTPVTPSAGAYSQRQRDAAMPSGSAISNPNPTAYTVRITCSRSDDEINSVLRLIQSHQSQRSTLLARTPIAVRG